MDTPTKKRKSGELTPPTTPSKINKIARSLEYFTLFCDEPGKTLFDCTICKKRINGNKKSNLTSHIATKHKDHYKGICSENPLIEHKRLKLLFDCIEVVAVNGRPLRSLNDSGILSMNESVLLDLKRAGREFFLNDPNLKEVKDGLKRVAEKVREKISTEVKNRAISLLVDIVTKRGRSILGVSIQYIVGGKVFTRSVGMIHLERRHTGKYLAQLIIDRLKELGIDMKQIITITTDNGANVLKMVKDLESHLREAINEQMFSPNEAIHTLDDDETIEREIASILATEEEPEDENDQMLNDIFNEAEHLHDESDDDGPTVQQVETNKNLLNELQDNMLDLYGLDVMWDVSGVNCAAHTLQLAIEDTFKAVSIKTRNTIQLCNRTAKMMRKQSTMCSMQEDNIVFTKPKIDVVTRWGSTYLMVIFFNICIGRNISL